MDDDVQYLGTRFAVQDPLDDPCEALCSVTGVILHVEKCGEKPAHDLTFHRVRSGYVNIGRKSGSDDRSMRRENDDHNAVFACQVVSARHAKLVLSDSGQVYIVDLHSRHGTHLLRRGETAPRMLQAEVETPLADGDVITFGKAVGAGSYHVSPVAARVELLRGRSSSEPSTGCVLTPFDPPSPVLNRSRKLSSGRYGLLSTLYIESDSPHSSSPISVSSDAASSPSELDSDVEDRPSCVPAVLRDSQAKTSVKIPAFRSFIREIYPHSPIIPDVLDDPLEDAPGSPSADPVRVPSPVVVTIVKSRSHSPMEVATPSVSHSSEEPQSEPAVIGAWPVSRPESPRHSSLEVETGRLEVPPVPEQEREPEPVPAQPTVFPTKMTPISNANEALMELVNRLPPPPPFLIGGPFSNSITADFGLPSVPALPPPPLPQHRMPPFPLHKIVADRVSSEIKGSLKSIEDRIASLEETISDFKSRQSVTEDDVADLQGHVDMLEPESERLLCRISGAERNIATLSTFQGQITTLQNQVTTLRGRLDAQEPRPVETPMDDIRSCANASSGLASEMRLKGDDMGMGKQIEAKIEAMRATLEAMQRPLVTAETPRSPKRKRDDEEVEKETPAVVAPADADIEPVACSSPVVVDNVHSPELPVPQVPVPQAPVPVTEVPVPEVPPIEPTRPGKRARTAMYTVAHTAAAMAIGAAATWSALAFS